MKLESLLFALSLSVTTAFADVPQATLNTSATLVSLEHTDRAKRSPKTAWLMPGKETRWYYKWILENGSTVTKVETTAIKGVPDARPFKERFPNRALGVSGVMAVSGPLTAAVVTAKKL